MKRDYNEVVRDKVPEGLRENGHYARCKKKVSDEEFERLINKKLLMYAKKVSDETSSSNLTLELAELLEIMHTIANIHDISFDDIEKMRSHLEKELGGYDKKVFLKYTYEDEDIEKLPRNCETCAIKKSCKLNERLNDIPDDKKGMLCVSYIPNLYKQKTEKTK